MRLDQNYIDRYKNLKALKIDFDEERLTTVIIGHNGAGGYYSGSSRRLERLFDRHQRKYYDTVNTSDDINECATVLKNRRLLFCLPIQGHPIRNSKLRLHFLHFLKRNSRLIHPSN